MKKIVPLAVLLTCTVFFYGCAFRTELQDAAESGDLMQVKQLVEKGADVNEKGQYGNVPLHDAVKHLDVVKYLVEKGADVNAKGRSGRSVLHEAAYYISSKRERTQGLEVVKYLVEKGADVNAKDRSGRSVLHAAAYYKHFEVVKYLVEKGADVNAKDNNGRSVFADAMSSWSYGIASFLMEKGVDLTKEEEPDFPDDDVRDWFWMAAVQNRNIDLIKFLLKKDAVDVEAKCRSGSVSELGMTALCFAARNGDLELVQLLVKYGADVNAGVSSSDFLGLPGSKVIIPASVLGRTVLHFAVMGGNLEVVKFLVEKGADVNAEIVDSVNHPQKAIKPEIKDYLNSKMK